MSSSEREPKVKGMQEGGCSQLRLGFWIQIRRGKECRGSGKIYEISGLLSNVRGHLSLRVSWEVNWTV